jgi:hypothetical protein
MPPTLVFKGENEIKGARLISLEAMRAIENMAHVEGWRTGWKISDEQGDHNSPNIDDFLDSVIWQSVSKYVFVCRPDPSPTLRIPDVALYVLDFGSRTIVTWDADAECRASSERMCSKMSHLLEALPRAKNATDRFIGFEAKPPAGASVTPDHPNNSAMSPMEEQQIAKAAPALLELVQTKPESAAGWWNPREPRTMLDLAVVGLGTTIVGGIIVGAILLLV